jgi:hypothetical protein
MEKLESRELARGRKNGSELPDFRASQSRTCIAEGLVISDPETHKKEEYQI